MNGHVGDKNGIPMETNGDVERSKNEVNGVKRGPIELYLNRISPPCKTVWLYMLQVCVLLSFNFS